MDKHAFPLSPAQLVFTDVRKAIELNPTANIFFLRDGGVIAPSFRINAIALVDAAPFKITHVNVRFSISLRRTQGRRQH